MLRIVPMETHWLTFGTVFPAFESIMHCADSDTFDFVTLRCVNLRNPWKDAASKKRLLSKLKAAKKRLGLSVAAYVLLDDHAHFLLRGLQGQAGATLMEELRGGFFDDCDKNGVSSENIPVAKPELAFRALSGALQARAHLDFIHYEPVLHGLVERAVDYDWSSFPTRVMQGHYPENWAAYSPPASLTRVHL